MGRIAASVRNRLESRVSSWFPGYVDEIGTVTLARNSTADRPDT